MLKDCEKCSHAAGVVKELLELMKTDTAPQVLHTLTDSLVHDQNLHTEDKCAIASVMHMITTGLREKLDQAGGTVGIVGIITLLATAS